MNNHQLTIAGPHANPLASLRPIGLWLTWLRDVALRYLARRHTRRILERLDDCQLEDIGVPYENMSLRSGELTRYDEIIRPRRLINR